MSRHPERWLLVLVAALVLGVGAWVIVAGHVLPVASGHGDGFTYRVDARAQGDGYFMIVFPVPRYAEDFTAYKAANDARLARWDGSPAAAPPLQGAPVAVTFRQALAPADVARMVGPAAAEIVANVLVGRTRAGRAASDYFAGPVDPAKIGVSIPGPGCQADPAQCDPVTYSGVIQVELRPSGGPATLAALGAQPEVYLADATGIAALADLRAQRPDLAAQVRDVYLPKPIWTTSGDVKLP
jgi:hypothetical protein